MRTLLSALLVLALAGRSAAARDVLSRVEADPSPAAPALAGDLTVLARVSPIGLVESARAERGDPRLRASAEAAVRWWVFAPAERASVETVRVHVAPAHDVEPMRPDVIAMAREAERAGDVSGALLDWSGVLNRVGKYPLLRNEWAIREHVIELERRLPTPFPPPPLMWARGRNAHIEQARTVTSEAHAKLVSRFDFALLGAPWWSEAYLWRAGSQLGCGRSADALRSLRAYRLGSRDTAGLALADWAITSLRAGDTLSVCERIKNFDPIKPDDDESEDE